MGCIVGIICCILWGFETTLKFLSSPQCSCSEWRFFCCSKVLKMVLIRKRSSLLKLCVVTLGDTYNVTENSVNSPHSGAFTHFYYFLGQN